MSIFITTDMHTQKREFYKFSSVSLHEIQMKWTDRNIITQVATNQKVIGHA